MIESYLTDTISIITDVKDEFGNITSTTSAPIKCMVTRKSRILRTAQGESVMSYAKVLLPKGTSVAPGTKLQLDGKTFRFLNVEDERDFGIVFTSGYIA